MNGIRFLCLASLVVLGSTVTGAQWLNQPTAGIPRTPDGKPNLNAPAPKQPDGTPDLSGFWSQPLPPAYLLDITADLPPQAVLPAASRLFEERLNDFGKDDPATIGCLPSGPRHIIGGPTANAVQIIHTPTTLVMVFEDLVYRRIHLDGRKLPADPNPSFMGYSVGRWEGDTLVVETTGFNGRTWLDFGGHPHGERLRTIERFRRTSFGGIDREVTLIDEEFYTKPIVLRLPMAFLADTDMLEYVCNENPRSRPHLVGRTEAERVSVAPQVLRRYAGTYDVVGESRGIIREFTLSFEDGQLFLALNGRGRVPMVAMSNTMFSARVTGTLEFFVDAAGNVTHVLAHAAEGTTRYERKP